MNCIIIFFIGAITFALMFLIKIPIKKLTNDLTDNYVKRKRMNFIVIIVTIIVAIVSYCFVLVWLGITHFKLCIALQGAALAMAFYAIYEQWFGNDGLISN